MHIVIIVKKKQDTYMDLDMVNVMTENYKLMFYFIMVQNLILDYLFLIWQKNALIRILVALRIVWKHF